MRAGSEAVTRTWIELDGRRVELGLPAQLGARLNSTQSGTLTASAGGQASDAAQSSQSDHAVVSLLAGTVVRWLVEDGASVNKDDPVVVIEAMKMETQVAASRAGVLRSQAAVGDFVEFGQQLGEVL
jgi:acetyl-CoA/propionyl-CoA carboxylase biotin carboxyl carrier protein